MTSESGRLSAASRDSSLSQKIKLREMKKSQTARPCPKDSLYIRIVQGDTVMVELSTCDLKHGRITYRVQHEAA